MKSLKSFLAASLLLATSLAAYPQNYRPSEENLAARKEFSRERFGIFLHWGIYASYAQGEWYLNTGELDAGIYSKAASGFYPANYDASAWVKAFKDAGAEYVTITSRHHDGFSMFDTKVSDYDIVDATPFGRDVIAELARACHSEGLDLHFYYSILDWMREDYPVGNSGRKTGRRTDRQDYGHYFEFMKAQCKELMDNYAPVRALWFDGYWDQPSSFDWRMPEFYRYLHSLHPELMIGNNHHILPIEGEDFQMFEKDFPGQNTTGFAPDQKVSESLPLEMCQTMNHTWGYSVKDQDYKSVGELVRTLARCVSMDTNLLLNIGPMANGELPGAALERLEGIGKWMRANSESVKGCGPGPVDGQDWGVSTAPSEGDGRTFYLHVFKAPEGTLDIQVPVKSRVKEVTALDGGAPLPFTKARKAATLSIVLPEIPADTDYVVKVILR